MFPYICNLKNKNYYIKIINIIILLSRASKIFILILFQSYIYYESKCDGFIYLFYITFCVY